MQRTLTSIFVIFLALTMVGCTSLDIPREAAWPVISVRQWGGTAANATLARPHKINRITLHHQGVAFPRGKDPQQYMRDLQSWSRKSKGWIDVPYHFAIDLDGRVYEGRDIAFAGDTNTSYDPVGHALIEVVGNFEDVEPNIAQLDAVVNLMAQLSLRHDVPVTAIQGHRDYAQTECPGKNLYRYLANGYFHAEVRERLARK